MIVYVESNFALELAFEQEQVSSARDILDLAESRKITLAFPSFILAESIGNILRRRSERNSLHENLVKTLSELQRSEPHKQIMVNVGSIIDVLKNAYRRELDLLNVTFDRLFAAAECIEVDIETFRSARAYQDSLALSPQDSIIYATVIADLRRSPPEEEKGFLSRDKEAFSTNPRIKSELASYHCRHIGSFVEGWNFIQNHIQKER